MNEREALEEIRFEAEFNGNDESLKRIIALCDRALAPQECDVKCVFCERIDGLDNLGRCANKELSLTFCSLNVMKSGCCNMAKQLHSQQKTFTQYQVRDILNCVLLYYLDNPSVDAYRLDVLKQFEKAVG